MRSKSKRMFMAGFICALILSLGFQAYGAVLSKTIQATYRDIKIYVNGELTQPRDDVGNAIEPFIYNGTTYLPVKGISQALGLPVAWENETSSVFVGTLPKEIKPTEVTVSTAEELIGALGSNKKIYLKQGVYDLSSVSQDYRDSQAQVYWEPVFDGYELTLKDIQNLTIEGPGEGTAEIIAEPRYAFVLSFLNSSNVNLVNIKAGHSEGGYCEGGVFSFKDSAHIQIDGALMYGCGTEGLRLENVLDMKVSDSSIYECTYDIMTVMASRNILFEKCIFRDNQEFTLINISNTDGLTMDSCQFTSNNAKDNPMFSTSLSKNITVKNSKFNDNTAKALEETKLIKFADNTFEKNSFVVQ